MAQVAPRTPNLNDDGAQLFAGVLADHEIVALRDEAKAGRTIRGGRRIYRAGAFLHDLLNRSGAVGAVAARFLGE